MIAARYDYASALVTDLLPMRRILIVILTGAACVVAAAAEPVGRVISVSKLKSSGVLLDTSSRAKIRIELFSDSIVRVRVAPAGRFEPDFSYALDPAYQPSTTSAAFSQDAREIRLSGHDGTRIVIARDPFSIRVVDQDGRIVLESDKAHPMSFDRATGEIQATMLRRSEMETYYGFGEKAFAEMSRHGKFIVNWNTDTFSYPIGTDPVYESIPFFTALYEGRAYGLFFNNTFRTWFDMGARSPGVYSFGADGGELDYFVFTGGRERAPRDVIRSYSQLTGRTPLPPIWALGNQQSRWSYFPESRVREIADGFRKNRIPADVIYLDIDYMDGYRVFTWDKKRFPDPPKLIGDLRKDGFRTVLIVDPGIKVDDAYGVYKDGQRAGIFVKNPDGSELHRNVWPQASAFPDFTDARARGWWGSQFKVHLDEGIAGFWNDMNEPGVFLTDKSERPEVMHHPEKTFPYDTPHKGDGLADTHRRYHNVFGMQMARATFEGVSKLAPDRRPFVLTRAGFAGVQRYSAVWTGDNYASWDHLALSIPMLLNMSVSGVPFVGCDVGGFNDRPSGELYTRWLQAAVFSPFLRSHSVGWSGNKEPWEYGDDLTAINRSTVELRYKFLPYLYTIFREHERTGDPVMRPLWYQFPSDKRTYLVTDEYLVGADLLVAPVVKEGLKSRRTYLPAGADWVNWWTGERLKGGAEYTVDAPLDRLPMFVRAGAVIPTQAVIQHTSEMQRSEITLNVVAGTPAGRTDISVLYQDAGDGYAYRQNGWLDVRLEQSEHVLKISRTGSFAGQQVRHIDVIGLTQKPREIRADGREIAFKYDEQTARVKAEISDWVREVSWLR